MKEIENRWQEAAEGEISSSAGLARPWIERVWRGMGSLSGGDIGAQERLRWETRLEDQGWVTFGGRAVCCEVGAREGTNLGDKGDALYVWTWGDLVGTTERVCLGSETRVIEVRVCVIKG